MSSITPLRPPTSAHETDTDTDLTTSHCICPVLHMSALNIDHPTDNTSTDPDILTTLHTMSDPATSKSDHIADTPTNPYLLPTNHQTTSAISDIPTDLRTTSESAISDHSALRHDQQSATANPTPMYRHTSSLHFLLPLHHLVRTGHHILPFNLHLCTLLPSSTSADDQEVII
ncbi:hypothetical protein OG21DRAFT_1490798 [Imleria badia]|nr:hypothetical protein OG21DRAFT_1490798 [Imleria badia]